MPKTTTEVIKGLSKKNIQNLYLLHGEEPYFIDKVCDFIEENALSPSDKSFNQYILFGKDLTIPGLLSYVKKFPMMAEKQLVLVKEAQQIAGLGKGKEEGGGKDVLKYLEDYLQNPLSSTVLVLAYKDALNEKASWVKTFDKVGVVMPSPKIRDYQLPDWLIGYCHERGVKVSQKAVMMLVEFVGGDLKRLASEIDKILLNLRVDEEISAQVVEKYVGISKEYNVFEFQKSLIQRDVLKANQIINFFAGNPKENPLPQVIIMLYNFFSKILMYHGTTDKSETALMAALGLRNTYALKDYQLAARNYSRDKVCAIVKAIKLADLKSKGIDAGSQTEADILKDLTFRILH